MPRSRPHTEIRRPPFADLPAFLQARRGMLLWQCLAGLLLAGLIAWELHQSHLGTRKASQLAAQNLSLLLKEQLDGAFRETDLVLRDVAGKVAPATLAGLGQLPPAELSALQQLLDDKLSTLPQVDTLSLLSPDGRWSLTPQQIRHADAEQQYLLQLLRDMPGQELLITRPKRLSGKAELGFVVGRRIAAPDGALGGMVVAQVNLEYFNQLARRLEAAAESAFALLDNDMLLVGRYPELPDAIGKPLPDSADFASWVNGRSNGYQVMRWPFDELARGYSFRRLESFPFITLVGVPDDAYFNDWRLKAGAYCIAFTLLLLFSFAMTWRGWREAQLALAARTSAARLQEQDSHLLRALDTLSRPLLLVGADNNQILVVNPSAAQLCGRPAEQLVGVALSALYLYPEQHAQIVEQLNSQQSISDHEIKFRKSDGGGFWVGLSASVIEYRAQRAYLVSLHDIGERKAMEETLWRKATLDPLTGIANRGYFLERAEQEWLRSLRYPVSLGVLMLDLDHFKAVNDQYGHDAGDQVLRSFASMMRDELRETDLFGRLGGEEFAILLPADDERGVRDLAERLRAKLADTPVTLDNGLALALTVSIGGAFCRPTGERFEVLLKQADQALYAAKHAGRNRVRYFEPPEARVDA
ncbi:diguanylate cyclase [Chitinimonas arctica]|uniref:Diguanylate cyclase n=1 Tax=Chitinimonas arctica TaxID=2594795 RepID=A0A516SF67_9NEIS|nr:diguanylate cyclase [Chitinimonas arctica]QDQ26782.1 diguanylate cyclase [Chitinimonas arctica]